jgi:hypothetical protein
MSKWRRDLPALRPAEAIERIERHGDDYAETIAWLNGLTGRAEQGDREALKQVVEVYKAIPRFWPAANLLQANAERSLLDVMIPKDQLFSRKTIERQLAQMRRDLAGPEPTALELLLVDRIVLCWLDTMHADTLLAQRHNSGMTFAQADYYGRRAERAQRQYLRAIKTLATVRRLRPSVQVNVAR